MSILLVKFHTVFLPELSEGLALSVSPSATVFAQDHSCSDSLGLQIHIQSSL